MRVARWTARDPAPLASHPKKRNHYHALFALPNTIYPLTRPRSCDCDQAREQGRPTPRLTPQAQEKKPSPSPPRSLATPSRTPYVHSLDPSTAIAMKPRRRPNTPHLRPPHR
ncbi:hypothetical protein B0H12DRAFT_1097274 [Mycena haematopus]|nr:hypothetical protein B0H12DRAFT_1097274 [Mycena haematopus]